MIKPDIPAMVLTGTGIASFVLSTLNLRQKKRYWYIMKEKTRRTLLAAAGVIVIAAGIYFGFIYTPPGKLTRQQGQRIENALKTDGKELPVGDDFRMQVDPDDLSITQGLDVAWKHFLLLGTDTGEITLNTGRTDAMMVLSLNVETGDLKLTSLIRDMLVDIPGSRTQNRINAANSFGGPLLAIKTVNELLELNITRYVSVNFAGFAGIIDHMGGVQLNLSEAEAKLAGVDYGNGTQILNGWQTLGYVRIRKLDNNFGRNERQRITLQALLKQLKNTNNDAIADTITKVLGVTSTNFTAAEIFELLPLALKNPENFETLSLPQEGKFSYARTEQGQSVIHFRVQTLRESFRAFISGQGSPDTD